MNILWQITSNKRFKVLAMTEWGDTSNYETVSLHWWFWAAHHKGRKWNFMFHKYLYIKHSEIQTLLHLHNSYVLESQTPVEFSANWSKVYISSIIYLYKKKSTWNSNSTTAEPNWPQHDHPTNRVITQYYSSTIFAHYSFTSQKEKFGTFKKCHYFTFFLLC